MKFLVARPSQLKYSAKIQTTTAPQALNFVFSSSSENDAGPKKKNTGPEENTPYPCPGLILDELLVWFRKTQKKPRVAS